MAMIPDVATTPNEVSLGLVPDAVSCIWSVVHLRSLLPSVEMKLPQQN
jgi:hypothetical protein